MVGMTTTTWLRYRDDYGRSAHRLQRPDHTVVGVVVKLPHVQNPLRAYLSNDWTIRGDAAVQYHRTLADAKARIEAAR